MVLATVVIMLLDEGDLTPSDFGFVERGMSLRQVCAVVGTPDYDPCSGVPCSCYNLSDGRVLMLHVSGGGVEAAAIVDEDGFYDEFSLD